MDISAVEVGVDTQQLQQAVLVAAHATVAQVVETVAERSPQDRQSPSRPQVGLPTHSWQVVVVPPGHRVQYPPQERQARRETPQEVALVVVAVVLP